MLLFYYRSNRSKYQFERCAFSQSMLHIRTFCQEIDKVNWNMNELNVHRYGTNFLYVFNQILDTQAPLIKTKNSKNQAKRNAKPWISNSILKSIKT